VAGGWLAGRGGRTPKTTLWRGGIRLLSLNYERLEQRRGSSAPAPSSLPRDYVFVPFQVALDSQVLLYSPWIRDMRHLFYTVVEAWRASLAGTGIELVFKAHPSAPEQYPDLAAHARSMEGVRFANGNATQELIDGAHGVITINSTVGIEALLRRRPVLTLGRACYAIPGVAERAGDVSALGDWLRRLAADDLDGAPLREAFLHYLANDYCVPDTHKAPGPAHCERVAHRLASTAGPATVAFDSAHAGAPPATAGLPSGA